ncbi:hypothetical protein E4U15_003715 [Claviceps sp. LM218 group G6]|nr:hypothetical protein E4U15_003715 [Claviceps sp. LM218 group G6]
MKKFYDTSAACPGVSSPDAEWAIFLPVLRKGYEHAQEMGRRDERKQQSLPTGKGSAVFSPLIIAVDGVETANRLCRNGRTHFGVH